MKHQKLFLLISVTIGFCLIVTGLIKFSISRKPSGVSAAFIPIKHHAEFTTAPAIIKAGEPAELRFDIKNEKGDAVRFLEFVHEKPLHLMIVSEDLNEFYHIHPELITDYYSVANAFPNGGKYHLYSDYTPPGGVRTLEQFEVNVAGKPRPKVALKPDANFTKTVDGLQVTMESNGNFQAERDYLVKFSVADEKTRQPVTDLQLYLGALAHLAMFSQDLKDFIHAHPLEAGEIYDPGKISFHAHNPDELAKKLIGPSPSEVKVGLIFPHAGIYKMWIQFQRHEKVINVPYVVKVGESEQVEENQPVIPGDAIRVSIGKNGYEPSRIEVKKGVPVKLALTRTDAENCAAEIVFPSLNIKRSLSVGRTELLEFTPPEAGEIAFACGMGMYKGIIDVIE